MSESNVAQDQIKAYVDRILRMKDEADAIASDIKEIYAEAKGNGFDKTQLGNLVTYLRKKDKDAEKVAEGEAIFDLYLEAYYSAKGQVGTRRATHTHASEGGQARSKARLSEAIDDNKSLSAEMLADGLISEEVHAENVGLSDAVAEKLGAGAVKKGDPLAALRADPAMAIVEAANITPKSNLQNVQIAQTEPQPSQPAGSDLTSLAPHEGQVAPDPVAKADDDVNAGGVDSPSVSSDARPGKTAEAESVSRVDGGRTPSATSEHMDVTAGETAPKYAEKGVVTWESTPPEGVERHPYSHAFGILGQDAVVIADDIAKASAAPIVKMGNVILDGWARYMTARGAVGLDGHSMEYPVVQYDGTDPLIDCIRWNIAGRILSDKDKQTVVARLVAIEPKRKADIIKAVAELAI